MAKPPPESDQTLLLAQEMRRLRRTIRRSALAIGVILVGGFASLAGGARFVLGMLVLLAAMAVVIFGAIATVTLIVDGWDALHRRRELARWWAPRK